MFQTLQKELLLTGYIRVCATYTLSASVTVQVAHTQSNPLNCHLNFYKNKNFRLTIKKNCVILKKVKPMIEKSSWNYSKSRELQVGEIAADQVSMNGLIRVERTASA